MHKNDKILALEEKIIQAREDYYNNDNPLISDEVFDKLCDELRSICPDSYALTQVGAAIQNTNQSKQWKVVKHKITMGSLDKVNEPEEMIDWIQKRAKYGKTSFVIMPKFDGLSLECVYNNGTLIEASLRGDGIEGFDILRNVKKMKGIKEQLDIEFTGSIRGEIIMYYDVLKQHFQEHSNVRNSASGICKRFDGEGCEYLNVVFYKMITYNDKFVFTTEIDMLNALKQLGLPIPQYQVCNTTKELIDIWELYQTTTRATLPFQIDGLVIEINDIAIQNELGDTNLNPNHEVAFKFRPEVKSTRLTGANWAVGASGHITPVAEVDMVELGGSQVRAASLHNWANIQNKKISIGSKVIVSKRNDIIPYVEEVLEPGYKEIELPTVCPVCGAQVEMQGKFLICPNIMECKAQLSGRIRNWVTTLKVLSWGTTIINMLVNEQLITNIPDIYKLTEEQLMKLPRLGEKSASKLYTFLHAPEMMNITLTKLIGGLSIPMVGETVVELVINAGYNTLDKLTAATIDDFSRIAGLGKVKANNLYVGLQKNKNIIAELLNLGITIKAIESGKLNGKLFCLTGTMTHDRDELENAIKNQGGVVKNSVVKNLSYLVCADTTTTKYRDAVKRGIPIISEEELLDML